MILGRYCNVKLDASNCRKHALKKKKSGFDGIHLYASQTLVGPCYRLSEKATFGSRALFRGDFYGHKKKSSWSTSVAPTVCRHFDINIWEIWHVLFRKRTNCSVCTGIFCEPKLLNYGLSKLETVRNLSYCLTECLLGLITRIFVNFHRNTCK